MSAQVERAMCEAIPTAAARWGRTDQGCASHALNTILHDGVDHHLCGMHLVMWADASSAPKHAALAEKWGWTHG